jgi:sialate O-acetylesterase
MKNLFVCLGVILMVISGCRSDNENQQNVDENDLFQSADNMLEISKRNYIDLEGNWRFSIGDDAEWSLPDFSDNNWEKIRVPGMWEDQGFHGYNGFAWYRKTFEIKKELFGKNFILNAGFIDDVDQTFINGKLIGMSGGFPPQYVTAYDAYREYYIPKEILIEGKNTIAIRVYDSQLGGGIIGGDVGLSPVESDPSHIAYLDLDINLRGSWKINIGDIGEWKDSEYDDTKWTEIFVPAFWETQGYKNYDGFAWYRLKFTLPEKLANQEMVLMLGMIDDIDQTYINGKLVGSTGDWNFDYVPTNFNRNYEWEKIRSYYIPANVLLPGRENTIAVRVFDGYIDGGIYKGPIGLITQEKYRDFQDKQND